MMTVGSLFAGIGGFDLGFQRAGYTIKWQVEIDPYCRRVLAKHWPNVKRWDDVRTFPPEGDWSVDVIVGGDPCQENSAARAYGNKCSQPSLGNEFIRVVDELRPRVVLRENPSHIRKDAPWPWQRFRWELERIGYVVLPFRLRACCFGADHQRQRVFLLAENTHTVRKSEGWAECKDSRETLSSVQGAWRGANIPTMDSFSSWLCTRAEELRTRDGFSGGVDVHRIRGLGNAVVPQVAEWIARQLVEVDKRERRG